MSETCELSYQGPVAGESLAFVTLVATAKDIDTAEIIVAARIIQLLHYPQLGPDTCYIEDYGPEIVAREVYETPLTNQNWEALPYPSLSPVLRGNYDSRYPGQISFGLDSECSTADPDGERRPWISVEYDTFPVNAVVLEIFQGAYGNFGLGQNFISPPLDDPDNWYNRGISVTKPPSNRSLATDGSWHWLISNTGGVRGVWVPTYATSDFNTWYRGDIPVTNPEHTALWAGASLVINNQYESVFIMTIGTGAISAELHMAKDSDTFNANPPLNNPWNWVTDGRFRLQTIESFCDIRNCNTHFGFVENSVDSTPYIYAVSTSTIRLFGLDETPLWSINNPIPPGYKLDMAHNFTSMKHKGIITVVCAPLDPENSVPCVVFFYVRDGEMTKILEETSVLLGANDIAGHTSFRCALAG